MTRTPPGPPVGAAVPTPPTEADLRELERLAMDLAVSAGQLVVARRPVNLDVTTKSSRTDVVTVMDSAAEELLRAQMSAARPDDGFLGEEAGFRVGGTGVTWVVDPIDGTVNYLYDLPGYAVSVAAVTGDPTRPGAWRPVAGAVYQPVTGMLYHARAGSGAAVRYVGHAVSSDTSLTVRPPVELADALVATGFSYAAEVRVEQAMVLAHIVGRIRDVRRAGSAALDLCAVASGRMDAFYERDLNPWDVAAGWLLVTEAGGLVTGWEGGSLADPGLIAASPTVHAALAELLAEALGELPRQM
ncbi:MAG TPA: inositol monophosphatase family protein [Dermatophilaceae bacterium]|nr:inositol monophosphatase family protein [Dermatophilaceae bacterium]